MKHLFYSLIALSTVSFAQTKPSLSTADKIAIQACEKAKGDAQKGFTQAQQQEEEILKEWKTVHAGFHVNPQTFTIEPDSKPVNEKKDGGK